MLQVKKTQVIKNKPVTSSGSLQPGIPGTPESPEGSVQAVAAAYGGLPGRGGAPAPVRLRVGAAPTLRLRERNV